MSDNNTVEGGGGERRSQVGTDREVRNDTMEVWTLKVAPANLAHQACHQTKGKSQKKKKRQIFTWFPQSFNFRAAQCGSEHTATCTLPQAQHFSKRAV